MTNKYKDKLLHDWELIFRQGLLTFWVFLAVRDSELTVAEIVRRVAELTTNTYTTSEQTVYRLLRKQYDLELVDYGEVPGNGGPNRKLYTLSPLGNELLASFAERNIRLFQQSVIFNSNKE